MDEWEIQQDLAAEWSAMPFVLAGHSVRLLAWEVMAPSWLINDSTASWGEPAVDFLGVASDGRLVAIEIKPRSAGPVATASAAAQALAAAITILGTVTPPRLEGVYLAARSGVLGRKPLGAPESLEDAVQAHTGGMSVEQMCANPVIPVVAVAGAVGGVGARRMSIEEVDLILAGSTARSSLRMRARLLRALEAFGSAGTREVEIAPLGEVEAA